MLLMVGLETNDMSTTQYNLDIMVNSVINLLIYLSDRGDKVNFLQLPWEVFVLGQEVCGHHVTCG